MAGIVFCLASFAAFVEVATLDRGICQQLLRRFDVAFALGNTAVYLICICAAALPSFASPACLLASFIFRGSAFTSFLIDSSLTRHRDYRLLLSLLTWIRLLITEIFWPQLDYNKKWAGISVGQQAQGMLDSLH